MLHTYILYVNQINIPYNLFFLYCPAPLISTVFSAFIISSSCADEICINIIYCIILFPYAPFVLSPPTHTHTEAHVFLTNTYTYLYICINLYVFMFTIIFYV
jgi:hypothetical protein